MRIIHQYDLKIIGQLSGWLEKAGIRNKEVQNVSTNQKWLVTFCTNNAISFK